MNDLFRERVTLRRVADGEARVISLTQLNRELRGEIIETDAATEAVPMDAWSDELLAMTDTVERPIPMALHMQRLPDKPVQLERSAKRAEGERTQHANAQGAEPVDPETDDATVDAAASAEGGQRRGRRRRRRRGRRGSGRRGEKGGADAPQNDAGSNDAGEGPDDSGLDT